MTESLQKLKDLALNAQFFTSDSRCANNDGIFVALKGEKTDGHSFAEGLLKSGSSVLVLNRDFVEKNASMQNHARVVAVENTAEAHRVLAGEFRKKFKGKIIGVGGSSGKTSTKDFLAHLLAGAFKVFKTEKSQNGELGIPRTLEKLDNTFDVAVIEIGIDAPGDMLRHVELVRPDWALLTSIGEEHLNLLKNIENVFREEKILFEKTWSAGGLCFAPESDAFLSRLSHPKLKFSPRLPSEVDPQFRCDLDHLYLLQNVALCLNVCLEMGLTKEQLLPRLATLTVPEGRGGVLWVSERLALVADYYNSNPSSVRGGIASAQILAEQKKIPLTLILGDMLDLGDESEKLHFELLKEIAGLRKKLYLVGPQMQKAARKILDFNCEKIFKDREDCSQHFKAQPVQEGVVLVKGSRGMGLEKVFEILKIH